MKKTRMKHILALIYAESTSRLAGEKDNPLHSPDLLPAYVADLILLSTKKVSYSAI